MTRHQLPVIALAGVTGLALLTISVYPMVWLAIGSLSEGAGWGLGPYRDLVTKFPLTGILANSWIFALGTTAMALVLGVGTAVLVTRTDIPGKPWLRLCTVLAFVSPPWLTAIAYVFLASPNAGLINVVLNGLVGVKPFNVQSMTGMIFVSGLFLYSFVYLTVEGALTSIDGAYEEAARTAGAGTLGIILRVTLPLVTPSIVAASVFSLIISWGLFATPAILGLPARVYVFSTQLYLFLNAFPPRLEQAAAMGMIFCLTAVLLGGVLWLLRRRPAANRFAVIAGKGHRPALLPLGTWRPLWAVAAWGVVVLSVALPFATVFWMSLSASWFGGGLGNLTVANFTYVVGEFTNFWPSVGNSIKISLMEAGLVLVVALAAAYVQARTRLPGRGVLTAIAYYTVLVPSVAFLAGAMWAWVKSPIGLYGTIFLIALTQAARSMPIAVRNLGDGLKQMETSLEEAATVCGAGRLRTVYSVMLPLLRPVLLSTFTLVFLSSLRDLNTPLFLGGGSPDTMTLSVVIFQFWSESRMGESAALSIILLLLTLVIFLPLYRLLPHSR